MSLTNNSHYIPLQHYPRLLASAIIFASFPALTSIGSTTRLENLKIINSLTSTSTLFKEASAVALILILPTSSVAYVNFPSSRSFSSSAVYRDIYILNRVSSTVFKAICVIVSPIYRFRSNIEAHFLFRRNNFHVLVCCSIPIFLCGDLEGSFFFNCVLDNSICICLAQAGCIDLYCNASIGLSAAVTSILMVSPIMTSPGRLILSSLWSYFQSQPQRRVEPEFCRQLS